MKTWVKVIGGLFVVVVAVIVGGVAVLMGLDFNQYKGEIAAQAKQATGRDLKIDGNLDLKISLTPSIEVAGVSFANAEWGSRPEMVTIDRFAAEVSIIPLLSGNITINRLILEGVDLLAETDKTGRANWQFGEVKEPAAESQSSGALTLPAVHKVAVRDIKVTYIDGVTGEKTALTLDKLDAAAAGVDDPVSIDIAGNVNDQTFSASGNVGSVNQMVGNEIFPLQLKAKAFGVEASVGGKLGTPDRKLKADLNVTAKSESIEDTLKGLGAVAKGLADIPPPPVKVLDFAGLVKLSIDTASIDGMRLALDNNILTGQISARHGAGKRPSISVQLKTDLLDLDALLPADSGAPAASSEPKDGRVFPGEPLPLEGLKAADADVQFEAGQIKAKGNTVSDVKVKLTLADGKLDLSELAATLADGRITGAAVVDAAKPTPTVKAKINVAQLDYGKLMEQQGLDKLVLGKADVDVDVSGAGGSVRAIMAGLNGKARVVTENGRIESGALNIVSADLMNVFDSKDDKTLKCGVVHFNIKGGMADAHAIVVETGGFSVLGSGGANLADETLNLRVDPRAKKANLASVAMVPVDVTGTFLKPEWAIDAAAMAGNAAAGAARTAGAIATMGLSLLVEKAAGSVVKRVDDTDYCAIALAGKKVVPGQLSKSESGDGGSTGDTKPAGETKKESNPVEGITKGLKSLFGN